MQGGLHIPRIDLARSYFTASLAGNDPGEDASTEALGTPFGSFFAVMDGHTGPQCAMFARENLVANMQRELQMLFSQFQQALQLTTSLHGSRVRAARAWDDSLVEMLVGIGLSHAEIARLCPLNGIPSALRKAFRQTDRDFFLECTADPRKALWAVSGCCALVAAFIGPALFVANAGDSRCVVGRRSGASEDGWEAFEMSHEHRASDVVEQHRILREHPGEPGVITGGRIKGRLQPSRSLGDGPYKNALFNQVLSEQSRFTAPYAPPYLTAEPEVRAKLLDASDAFVIVASDGLWDLMTSTEAVSFVGAWLDSRAGAGSISEDPAALLIRRALQSPRRPAQHDDITVTIAMVHEGCPRVSTDVMSAQCVPEVVPPVRQRLASLLPRIQQSRSGSAPPPPSQQQQLYRFCASVIPSSP